MVVDEVLDEQIRVAARKTIKDWLPKEYFYGGKDFFPMVEVYTK